MIEQLTKEQEAQLDVYCKKFTALGLKTRSTAMAKEEWAKVTAAVEALYAQEKLGKPVVICLEGGPVSALCAYDVISKLPGTIADIKPAQVVKKVKEILAKMDLEAMDKLALNHGQLSEFSYGSHEAAWVGHYAYVREVLKADECKEVLPFADLMEIGWWLAYDGLAILSSLPVEMHLDTNGSLHKDGGMAIRYSDGWGVHCLHGVRVPAWLAETPAEQIVPTRMTEISNAEVRKEFVAKVGIDRVCHAYKAKVVEKSSVKLPKDYDEDWLNVLIGLGVKPEGTFEQDLGYELLELTVPGLDGARKYLKMINPSTGSWHVEGVPNTCRNIREALAFRNGTDELPARIS